MGTHLASMKTLAISVRSAFRFFACGMCESRVAFVRETPRVTAANRGSRRRRGVNQSAEKSAEIPPMSLVARRASRVGPRTHRLRGRHLLGLGLGLHRAQGLLEPVRLEVRLDGRDQVGGVRTHRATVGGRLRRAATRCEPSPRRNIGGVFFSQPGLTRFRARAVVAFFLRVYTDVVSIFAHAKPHKVDTKDTCACSRKTRDVAAPRAFDSAVGIAPRVKVRERLREKALST